MNRRQFLISTAVWALSARWAVAQGVPLPRLRPAVPDTSQPALRLWGELDGDLLLWGDQSGSLLLWGDEK
jgi:hypothetical protein